MFWTIYSILEELTMLPLKWLNLCKAADLLLFQKGEYSILLRTEEEFRRREKRCFLWAIGCNPAIMMNDLNTKVGSAWTYDGETAYGYDNSERFLDLCVTFTTSCKVGRPPKFQNRSLISSSCRLRMEQLFYDRTADVLYRIFFFGALLRSSSVKS